MQQANDRCRPLPQLFSAAQPTFFSISTYAQVDNVLDRQYATLFRDHPFLEAKDQILWLRQMFEQRSFRDTLHLN
ncbi:hypothetical protein SH467x_003653 [Pirellulaceae bacterium SH467]